MKEGSPWWYGILQGVVALAVGVFLLVRPTTATLTIALLAAIYLVLVGAVHTYRGLRLRSAGEGNIIWVRGLVALVVGAILLLMELLNIGSLALGYTILAIGLIIFGALGLFTGFFQRGGKEFGWGPILVSVALLAWGVLVFLARSMQFDLAMVSGWILVAIGAIVLVWTFLRRPKSEAATA